MRKIIYIVLMALLASCSGTRKMSRTAGKESGSAKAPIADVLSQNITTKGFNIPKCEIEINTGEFDESFVAGIRYEFPGKYLITVKTILGIELARIYMTADTVLANERIGRTLYYGKPAVLSYKYGIPFEMIPVLFGDMVLPDADYPVNALCTDGVGEVGTVIQGRKIVYQINCDNRKVQETVVEGGTAKDMANVKYSQFQKSGALNLPSEVQISGRNNEASITLKIAKIEPWEGKIEFIPGNRYQKVELK